MLQDILNFQLLVIGDTPITTGTLVVAIVVVLVFYVISRVSQRAMTRALTAKDVGDEGSIAAGRRLLHYVIMLVGIAVAVHTAGINLSALFAAGAIFAVGIGFAMQTILQNFVSGVILLMERTIQPKDILEVEGRVVRVMKMGIRSTVARTRDDEDLIIPNSVLAQSTVKNFTLQDSLYRLRAQVGVTYSSDMRLVMETLKRMAAELTWRSTKREPAVLLTAFGASSVDFEVSVWVEDPWGSRGSRSDLYQAMWWALKDAGVVIAFPQLDVHFDPPVAESFATLGSRAA